MRTILIINICLCRNPYLFLFGSIHEYSQYRFFFSPPHLICIGICRVDAVCYALQEEFVADQLFQSSEHSSDDLFLITHSVFSSSKVSCLNLILFVCRLASYFIDRIVWFLFENFTFSLL